MPCSKDEAGYRVFDAAFAVDRNDDSMSVVKIRYTHTMMRDQEAYHSRRDLYSDHVLPISNSGWQSGHCTLFLNAFAPSSSICLAHCKQKAC